MDFCNRADRAWLFTPFDALKGFREALSQQEIVKAPKKELPEEALEELDRCFRQLEKGALVTLTHYRDGMYVQSTGIVDRIDTDRRTLCLSGIRIPLRDITEIHLPPCML